LASSSASQKTFKRYAENRVDHLTDQPPIIGFFKEWRIWHSIT